MAQVATHPITTTTTQVPQATQQYVDPYHFAGGQQLVSGVQFPGAQFGTQVYPNNFVGQTVYDHGVQTYVDHGVQAYADHSGIVAPAQHILAPGFEHGHQVIHEPQLSLEEKINKFSSTLAATIQLLAPDNNPFTREVRVVKLEKEVVKSKVPVYTQVLVGGVQQLQLREQEISSSNIKMEAYSIEVEEPRQLATGQWVNVKVKVEKLRPALSDDEYYGKDDTAGKEEIKTRTFVLKGVPAGADPSEFSAENKTLLSDSFVKAIKDSIKTDAQKKDLKVLLDADNIVWGPKAGDTDERKKK
jgi:hypothetical protein